jgi:hypothetical protein
MLYAFFVAVRNSKASVDYDGPAANEWRVWPEAYNEYDDAARYINCGLDNDQYDCFAIIAVTNTGQCVVKSIHAHNIRGSGIRDLPGTTTQLDRLELSVKSAAWNANVYKTEQVGG